MFVRQCRELARTHLFGEALDAIVRGVHLEDQAGFRSERADIVLLVRPIGGADLGEFRPGPAHDFRHAKGTADLDQFPARDDRFAPTRKCIEHQQHRGGIVVDDRRILRAGQLAEKITHEIIALAATASSQIELQRNRVAHRDHRRFDRGLGDDRPAQIRMQHGPRKVEDGAEVRSRLIFKARGHAAAKSSLLAKLPLLRASASTLRTVADDGGAPETLLCLNQCGVPHHLVDRGKLAQCGGYDLFHAQ